jgi:hypothetical protein
MFQMPDFNTQEGVDKYINTEVDSIVKGTLARLSKVISESADKKILLSLTDNQLSQLFTSVHDEIARRREIAYMCEPSEDYTIEQWVEDYDIDLAEDGTPKKYGTLGVDFGYLKKHRSYCWTMRIIDGTAYIINGYHTEDRECHFIGAKKAPTGDCIEIRY